MPFTAALSVALKLGRISNLPTVWTNTLAGVVLAGGSPVDARMPLVVAATSLFYIGGMYLNDAFDREFDARLRPDRPIPAGQVTAAAVFNAGFGMLAAGLGALVFVGYGFPSGTAWRSPIAGAALAGCIVLYDAYHKQNPASPVLMGACRALVYVTASLSVASVLEARVVLGAVALLCYLIGLTYTAKREHLKQLGSVWPLIGLAVPVAYGVALAVNAPEVWPFLLLFTGAILYALRLLLRRARGDVPRAVVVLIAGISLLDAVLLSAAGVAVPAALAVAGFALTLALQRFVSGT